MQNSYFRPAARIYVVTLIFYLFCFSVSRAENFTLSIDSIVSPNVPGPGAGIITDPSHTDVYTFQGTNGQIVFLEEISVDSSFAGWLYWELKSPTSTLSSGYFQGTHEGRKVLPVTGTYTVTVRVLSQTPGYVGNYSFRVRSVPPDNVFSIQIGGTVSNGVPGVGAGNLEIPGAHDVYQFEATAGKLAFFERISAAPAFEGWLQWELKSPGGQVVFRTYYGSGHDGRKTLPETGTYTLRVADGTTILSHTGQYAFRIRDIPADQNFPIAIGQTVSNNLPGLGAGNIEVSGAYDLYTFDGDSGQNVFFEDMQAASSLGGWLQWEVRAPSGQLVFLDYVGGSPAGRKTLPETGTYTIKCAVASTDPALIGTYAFRIVDLDDAQVPLAIGQSVTNGMPVPGAGNIEQAGNQDLYTFNATAGQRIVFHEISAAAAFQGWLRMELRAPSSNEVFAVFFQPGRVQARVMPETGTYRMRVYAGAANASYFGAYAFRTYCEVFAHSDKFALSPGNPLAIPFGKVLCNDTWEPGDAVTISLPANQTVYGGTITNSSSGLVYTPPQGFTGVDSFVYQISGIFGDTDTNTVNVVVGPGADFHATVVSFFRDGPSSVKVCLLGAPDQTYNVEQSTDLQSWQPFGTLKADADGSMLFNYTTLEERRYYRFRRP